MEEAEGVFVPCFSAAIRPYMHRVSARGWGMEKVGLRETASSPVTSKILHAYTRMFLNAT